MIVKEGDLEFDFSDAVDTVKFDNDDHGLSHCMKAVDFIVEMPNCYFFIEVKDPSHPKARDLDEFYYKAKKGELSKVITGKFRDSFVYRWAQDKLEKPVRFICLMTLEEALLTNLQNQLKRDLPMEGPTLWAKQIAESCCIVNIDAWNRNYPNWPVCRLSTKVQKI